MRIRQEQQTAIKLSSSSEKTSAKETQVVTQSDVKSVISELVQMVDKAENNQFLVSKLSTIHLVC